MTFSGVKMTSNYLGDQKGHLKEAGDDFNL